MKYIFVITGLILTGFFLPSVFAQSIDDAPIMFEAAKKHFVKGEYNQAITIYDEILEIVPNNISTLKMKAIAESNLGHHERSLKQFFRILQYQPNDAVALTGMGVGFGNLGEYQEAQKYFKRAMEQKPNSTVVKNYNDFVSKVIAKYPYIATEKPPELERIYPIKIPEWVKQISKWWSEDKIGDSEFISALRHMIENRIIQIPHIDSSKKTDSTIPKWVKDNAAWWSEGMISDLDFVAGIQFMIQEGIIIVNIDRTAEEIQEEKDREFYFFEKYLRSISKNVLDEKRYIEYPNPSQDVIKKFLRDYIKWNFEEEVKTASSKFPDPTYEIINGTHVIHYKVYVNEQPSGLPLDHVSTLKNSFLFWESQELNSNNQKARIQFEIVEQKHEANVWVTWVVRNIGEGVLGHAHLGKGVVEVTLGDYNCDGSFQLYDVNSVEAIMTHELGHSIGLPHVNDSNNIMYPSMNPKYAYCLLS